MRTGGSVQYKLDDKDTRATVFGSDIRERIEKEFGSFAPAVAEELERFIESYRKLAGAHPGDRVIRCIVHLAEGNREHITHYIRTALGDPRDVMFWAEYDKDEKRVRDFNMPFPKIV